MIIAYLLFIQLIYSCFSRNLVSTNGIAPCSVYKPYTTYNSSTRSDEGLTLETSAFQSLYGGQFALYCYWNVNDWSWRTKQINSERTKRNPIGFQESGHWRTQRINYHSIFHGNETQSSFAKGEASHHFPNPLLFTMLVLLIKIVSVYQRHYFTKFIEFFWRTFPWACFLLLVIMGSGNEVSFQ